MNYSIAAIIRRVLCPKHKLSCSWWMWRGLWKGLHDRGEGQRESGAFLLGITENDGHQRIRKIVFYDELDPHCLDTGIIRFDGRYFGKLWSICSEHQLQVLADVHTHPGGSKQSTSDQANPMITRAGHVALIIPQFASGKRSLRGAGLYRYLGGGRWETLPTQRFNSFMTIGI